jgi:hypothetical protein
MIDKALSFSCAQSMNELFDNLLRKYEKSSNATFVSDLQKQNNTDELIRDFNSLMFSDKFWAHTKEHFIAFISANKIELSDQNVMTTFNDRHLLHKHLANGFLSFVSNIANTKLDNPTTKSALSFDTKSQLFKNISYSIVKDSADVVQIKLISDIVKQRYVSGLLSDPAYLHLISMSQNAKSSDLTRDTVFSKIFEHFDGQYPQNLMLTGTINSKGQHFMGYMRDLGNSFNGDLFMTGLQADDITNSLAYKLVLNSDNTATWLRFANNVDLSKYTYSDESKDNAFIHFLKSVSDIGDFVQFKEFLNGLNSENFRQMGNPEFLSKLNHRDAAFVFNAFLERYSSTGLDLKSLEGYLKPQILSEYPFILQAMLERHNTREIVFEFCLKNDLSPVTYASKLGLDVKTLVNSIYGQFPQVIVNRVIGALTDKVEAQPSNSIAKAKSLYQAIEFRMFLYKCGSIPTSSHANFIDEIENLSREFRENLQHGLAGLGPVSVSVEDITNGSRWEGDIEIDRLQRSAARVINQHNLEHSINLNIEPEVTEEPPVLKLY